MAPVTLFDEPNFSGTSVDLSDGAIRFMGPQDFNDAAVSIRVAPGYGVMLYEHANDNGGYGVSVDLLEDCANLAKYDFSRKASYVRVFRTETAERIYVRASRDGQTYHAGHWERKRADGTRPAMSANAAVSPPIAPPTTPQDHVNSGPIVRDHRGEGGGTGRVSEPPDHGPGWGGVVHDHRKSKIKHVFVLVLENRSFDHMLGFSAIAGTDAQTLQPTTIEGLNGTESNSYNGAKYTVVAGAPDRSPYDPGHGFPSVLEQLCGGGAAYQSAVGYPPINNSGFASSYAKSHPDLPDGAMKCFTPEQVPVITALAKEFLVCDRWFCSMPGPTEPNRWFIHAATAGDFDESPSNTEILESMTNPLGGFEFERGTIFTLLNKHSVKYRIYAGDSFPNVAELDGVSRTLDVDDIEDFAGDVASEEYDAAYTFIEPSYDVFGDFKSGSSQHPLGSAKAGERLIKQTYEALRKSPKWGSSMLIVTYDEHGGHYDHIAPPGAEPTGSIGRKYGFVFDRLGPRVPAIVVSPLIPRNLIDHRQYEHSSIISTLIDLFGLDPLTRRSSTSSGLKHLATLAEPRGDTPESLPEPAGATIARTVNFRFSDATAAHPEAPLSDDPNGNIAAVIRSGLAQHLEVTPREEHPAILKRVKSLNTHGEALQYLKEVDELVHRARVQAGIKRSASVRSPQARTSVVVEPVTR